MPTEQNRTVDTHLILGGGIARSEMSDLRTRQTGRKLEESLQQYMHRANSKVRVCRPDMASRIGTGCTIEVSALGAAMAAI